VPLRRLPALFALSFAVGALLYGTPVSLLHLLHNDVREPLGALRLFATFHLLYGAFFASAVTAAGAALATLQRRWRRMPLPAVDADALLRPFLWGTATFHFVFWFLYWNYGLTYDELPFVAHGFWPMAGWIALRSLGVALGVLVATVSTAAVARALAGPRRLAAAGLAALAVSLAAHLLAAGVVPAASEPPSRPNHAVEASLAAARPAWPVVVLGIDGADWRVADPLLAAGRLPNLAQLLARGSRASLDTLPDSNSAVIWATIYSGKAPAEHRVEDFYTIHGPGLPAEGLFPVHRTYFKELALTLGPRLGFSIRTVDRSDTKQPLLWEIADHAGLAIGLVDGYFYSFPALAPRHPESFVYAYGLDYFHQHGLDLDGNPAPAETFAQYVQPIAALETAQPYLDRPDWEWQSATLLAQLRSGRVPRLVSLYTHEPDTVKHQTWRGMEPQWYLHVSARTRQELGGRIAAFYESFDRFLGELVAVLPPEAAIVVVSDHGHSPTPIHAMDTQHRHGPPGILVLAGGPFRARQELAPASVYDVLPTLLYLLDLPVPEDLPGRVLEGAFTPAALQGRAIRRIPTFAGTVAGPAVDASRSRELDAEEIRKLEALGYL
jgi:hypothetical protein